MQMRKFEYGHGNAIMILVADQMGLSPSLVAEAKLALDGGAVHVMTAAAIEKEAVRMNDVVRHSAALVQANAIAETLKVQFGFAAEVWTEEDSAEAQKQGWDLFEASSDGKVVSLIERCDEQKVFADDDAALAFVQQQAAEGSAIAAKALRLDHELNVAAEGSTPKGETVEV
jgi:hypothetical protein